jgi:hypothetical protein
MITKYPNKSGKERITAPCTTKNTTSQFIPGKTMLNKTTLNKITLSKIMLSKIMLNKIMLSKIMLSKIMLNKTALNKITLKIKLNNSRKNTKIFPSNRERAKNMFQKAKYLRRKMFRNKPRKISKITLRRKKLTTQKYNRSWT